MSILDPTLVRPAIFPETREDPAVPGPEGVGTTGPSLWAGLIEKRKVPPNGQLLPALVLMDELAFRKLL